MPAVFGVADLERIVAFARKFPIFPCRSTAETIVVDGRERTLTAKSPLTQNGFHAASQDPAQIRAWWRQWPDALVGVPTGQGTELVVVDYDPDNATQATHEWIAEHTNLLCSTRAHKTARGGLHYLFRSSDRYQTGTNLVLGGSPRKGIDLRANGGYVIWWPLHGGDVVGEAVAPVPAGLIDERRFEEKRDLAPLSTVTPPAWAAERQRIVEALGFLHPDGYEFWIRIGMAIHHASGGSDEGFSVWHEWSSRGETYDGIEDCRYHWGSFGGYGGRALGLGTVYAAAKAAGFSMTPPIERVPDEVYEREARSSEEPEKPEKPAPERRPMRWSALESTEPPQRIWRIEHWLGIGPTLLAGSGGVGKSLLAQCVGAHLGAGRFYVENVVEPQTVLMWACEDDHDEIWRRQVAISRYMHVPMREFEGRLIIEPRLGMSNTLFGLAYGQPVWTALRDELIAQIHDYRATVVILDNISQIFGGSENDRHHVTTFVNGLSGLTPWPLSTILLGHPSKAAGSEFSGSTAWENAVRMRWFLGTQLPDQPESNVEDNVRYLAKRKSNYSVKDYRRLTYQDGLFVPDNPPNRGAVFMHHERQEGARRVVLAALRKIVDMGMHSTASTSSPDYLPKRIITMKLGDDYTQRELAEAMNALLIAGRLKLDKVGQYANRTPKMGLVEAEK